MSGVQANTKVIVRVSTRLGQEVVVVRHEAHCALQAANVVRQPFHRACVQVVGGLIFVG